MKKQGFVYIWIFFTCGEANGPRMRCGCGGWACLGLLKTKLIISDIHKMVSWLNSSWVWIPVYIFNGTKQPSVVRAAYNANMKYAIWIITVPGGSLYPEIWCKMGVLRNQLCSLHLLVENIISCMSCIELPVADMIQSTNRIPLFGLYYKCV